MLYETSTGCRFPPTHTGLHLLCPCDRPPVGRKWHRAEFGFAALGITGKRVCPVSNRRVFVFLPGDRCRPRGPKPREAVAPKRRRPAPGRPGEPLPARGRRHHAPGRRQLPRQAPRGRRPGAPARRPRPPEAGAPVSAAAGTGAALRTSAASPPARPPDPPRAIGRPRSSANSRVSAATRRAPCFNWTGFPQNWRTACPRAGGREHGLLASCYSRSVTSSSALPTPGLLRILPPDNTILFPSPHDLSTT